MLARYWSKQNFRTSVSDSRVDESEKHSLFRYVCMVNLIHAVLLIFFVIREINILVLFNLVAFTIWIGSYFLFKKQMFQTLVLVTSSGILFHVVLTSYVFGAQSGVQMILWPLACIFAINTRVSIAQASLFGSLCFASFLYIELTFPNTTELTLFPYSLAVFVIVCGSPLVSAVMKIRHSFRQQRSELMYLANRDPLTGMYNRSYFTSFLEYQLKAYERERTTFCIALADIDHFKKINDQHGHDMGDKVLKHISGYVSSVLAKSDALCRWGGEEFIIFLPRTSLKSGVPVFEAIREVVSDNSIDSLKVTMSFGVVQSQLSEDLDDLLKRADDLLYQAKNRGRNNIQHVLEEPAK